MTAKITLGDGSRWGVNLQYAIQTEPKGLPDAGRPGETFLAGEQSILILGDNILFGQQLSQVFSEALQINQGAHLLLPCSGPRDWRC